jgi:hypothetical protein
MRRILVEIARRKRGPEAGGEYRRVELSDVAEAQGPHLDLIALSDALEKLQAKDHRAAELVKLRFFAPSQPPIMTGLMPRDGSKLNSRESPALVETRNSHKNLLEQLPVILALTS